MTEPPQIPVVPGADPTLAQMMPPAEPLPVQRPRWVLPVVVALAVLLLAAGGGVAYLLAARNAAPVVATPSKAQGPTVVDAQPPARTYYTPKPSDFEITPKIVRKNCFGSAGCNVTYSVEVVYNGLPFEPGSDWDVTYEVTGGEDPQINTFGITGTSDGFSYSPPRDQLVQTAKSSSVLAIKVTSVTRA